LSRFDDDAFEDEDAARGMPDEWRVELPSPLVKEL
jgi:hypothetical protein